MLNYRLRQLMPVWHATELVEFVADYDPRITYWPSTKLDLYTRKFDSTITERISGSGTLTLVGDLTPDETAGRLYHWWIVTRTSTTTASVERLTAPRGFKANTFTVTADLSSAIPLLGSSLSCVITGPVGSSWFVEATAKPQRDMGDLLATLLDGVSGTDERALFGSAQAEPVKTWYNLWKDHPSYSYKLGGLLLGVVYELDRLYKRGA